MNMDNCVYLIGGFEYESGFKNVEGTVIEDGTI